MREDITMLRLLRPYKFLFTVSFLSMSIASLFNGISIGALSPLVRVLFGGESAEGTGGFPSFIENFFKSYFLAYPPFEAIFRISIFILIIIFLRAGFLYLQQILSTMVEEKVVRDVRNELFSKLLNLPLGFFHRATSGELISRFINDTGVLRGALARGLMNFLRESLNMLIFLSIALIASWQLALFSLVVFPLFLGVLILVSKKIRKRSKKTQEKMGHIGTHLSETISGMKIVKGFGSEERELKNFRNKTDSFYTSRLRLSYVSALGSPLVEILSAVVAVIILIFGVKLIFELKVLTPDRFVVFLAAVISFLNPMKRVANANSIWQQGVGAMRRIEEILDIAIPQHTKGNIPFQGLSESIRIEKLYFGYNKGTEVLKDINLTIEKGEKIALVGPSGVGKSTLADIIAGFYIPSKGRVIIDGIDIKNMEIKSYRKKIAIVPQEPFLFSGSIYDNIAYSMPEATREEIINAARIAYADEFIERLPRGYGTLVGERGITLSGGERQRIVLARAILRNPDIFILDEPTSSLDSESEDRIKLALSRIFKGRTSIIIAHRLSTVIEADRIVVMNRGKIIDTGKHNELLERCPLYRRLYEIQFEVKI